MRACPSERTSNQKHSPYPLAGECDWPRRRSNGGKKAPNAGLTSPTSSFRRYASYVSGRDAYGASDAAAVFAPSISLLGFARDALVHLLRGCGRRHGRRCRLSLLLRSYPVRWHRHSDPPPGGQPHSEGCSVIGSDGRTVTNEGHQSDSECSKGEKR